MKVWQILVTCLLVAIATAYFAKEKGRSPWLWGALGFAVFGIVFHTIVGVLVFLIFA